MIELQLPPWPDTPMFRGIGHEDDDTSKWDVYQAQKIKALRARLELAVGEVFKLRQALVTLQPPSQYRHHVTEADEVIAVCKEPK